MLLDITRHTPLLPQTSSDTERNNLVDASVKDNTSRNLKGFQRHHAHLAKQTEFHQT
jgi:hypothetical protein